MLTSQGPRRGFGTYPPVPRHVENQPQGLITNYSFKQPDQESAMWPPGPGLGAASSWSIVPSTWMARWAHKPGTQWRRKQEKNE